MTQTWWVSFCDGTKPEGQQFLGVAIIDVTEDEAFEGRVAATLMRIVHGRPPAEADVGWMTAAIGSAHLTGCNPGGEVMAVRIDDQPKFAALDARLPRNRLLQKSELEQLEVL